MFVAIFACLLAINGMLSVYFWDSKQPATEAIRGKAAASEYQKYLKFRNNYLLVYLCMMMADWLQGPYVYALYKHYGFGIDQIGQLFMMGFISSALFGTGISSLADIYGRKKMCLAFVVIYSGSCITKFFPSFHILLLGRLLGGVSTSLLFSVFEAWLVSAHKSQKFPDAWLSSTFSWATYGNGMVAILSGVIANAVVEISGSFVAPFVVSIVFLALGGSLVATTWTENYGRKRPAVAVRRTRSNSNLSSSGGSGGGADNSSSLWIGFKAVTSDVKIFSVGCMVALFEGSMYTFVFLWGPVLENEISGHIPYGLIFATFMVCIMMGSIGFRWCLSRDIRPEFIMPPLMVVATLSLFIPIFSDGPLTFMTFNLFELCCGVYFPTMGTLRSKYVPEETRATVMNIFRVPLNLIVVVVLMNISSWTFKAVFSIISVLMAFAIYCAVVLRNRVRAEDED